MSLLPISLTDDAVRADTARPRRNSRTSAPGRAAAEARRSPYKVETRWIPDEIDYADAKFRRKRSGPGKCTGGDLEAVQHAFAFGFVMCRAAKLELQHMWDEEQAFRLWKASNRFDEASLEYWFGSGSGAEIREMWFHIWHVLNAWDRHFRKGFSHNFPDFPVFIRCKSNNAVGNPNARHIEPNTIEVTPRFMNLTRAQQAAVLLHEMGHHNATVWLRDQRDGRCSGGWNRAENMCYRRHEDITVFEDIYRSGDPRVLAERASAGSREARKLALHNVDNYVCFMWNRYVDRGEKYLAMVPR